MKRLGVITNPASGNGAGKHEGEVAIRELQRGAEVIELTGSSMLDSANKARAAIADFLIDGLVVVGGDGMVHTGVNLCANSGIPLGIIAAGTGNDAARTLGLPLQDAEAGARIVLNNLTSPREVDLLECESSTGKFWSFGTVSAGFDALVNQRANQWKWPKGPSRYQLAMLAELASFRPIHFDAVIDGVERKFDAMLCAVVNSPQFGGGMKIVPSARIDDGFLELFIVHKISRPELIRVFPRVYTGEHITHPAVEIIKAKEVSISSGSNPAYSDGEPVGFSPIKAKIASKALRVFATSAHQSQVA